VDQVPFSALDHNGLAQARSLYEDAFPSWEREDFDRLVQRGAGPGARQMSLVDDDGTVVGIATLSTVTTSKKWWFLEYFAVAPQQRGHGIGSRFWQAIAEDLHFPVVLEIEQPDDVTADPNDLDVRRRRLRFWQRLGFVVLPVHRFRVPRLDGDGDEPMLLMASVDTFDLPPDDLRTLVAAVYTQGYGLPESHELAIVALGSIG
jgi:GNAT superfamily N-acetyltransferase